MGEWKTNRKTRKRFVTSSPIGEGKDSCFCEICKTDKAVMSVFCPIKRRMLRLCKDCGEQVKLFRAKKIGCWSANR